MSIACPTELSFEQKDERTPLQQEGCPFVTFSMLRPLALYVAVATTAKRRQVRGLIGATVRLPADPGKPSPETAGVGGSAEHRQHYCSFCRPPFRPVCHVQSGALEPVRSICSHTDRRSMDLIKR